MSQQEYFSLFGLTTLKRGGFTTEEGRGGISRKTCLAWFIAGSLLPLGFMGDATAQENTPRVIDVRIESRQVVEPKETIRAIQGDLLELRWTSGETMDPQLHGYDGDLQVQPDAPNSMVVEAFASGRFPITSPGCSGGVQGHDALIFLEVDPD